MAAVVELVEDFAGAVLGLCGEFEGFASGAELGGFLAALLVSGFGVVAPAPAFLEYFLGGFVFGVEAKFASFYTGDVAFADGEFLLGLVCPFAGFVVAVG